MDAIESLLHEKQCCLPIILAFYIIHRNLSRHNL